MIYINCIGDIPLARKFVRMYNIIMHLSLSPHRLLKEVEQNYSLIESLGWFLLLDYSFVGRGLETSYKAMLLSGWVWLVDGSTCVAGSDARGSETMT